jgi:hypothetical protein
MTKGTPEPCWIYEYVYIINYVYGIYISANLHCVIEQQLLAPRLVLKIKVHVTVNCLK